MSSPAKHWPSRLIATSTPTAGSLFIDPDSPWQNAWIESFNGRLRYELLNLWRFDSLLEGRVMIEDWRADCRELGASEAYHRWRKRLKDLERENATPKRLPVDAALEKDALRAYAKKQPRRGFRPSYQDARGEGWIVNHKKIQRLWREEVTGLPTALKRSTTIAYSTLKTRRQSSSRASRHAGVYQMNRSRCRI